MVKNPEFFRAERLRSLLGEQHGGTLNNLRRKITASKAVSRRRQKTTS
jgi:hypothetical protein